jgi:phage N-6-adenine-methyltransferase
MNGGLVKYEAACRAVAEAKSIDEAKDIADKAEAMRCYARQAHNPELEADAWEIRKRAEDKLGELSAALDKSAGGNNPIATLPIGGKSKADVLKDVGLSTSTANRYEQFHRLPDEEKESRIAQGRQAIKDGKSAADKIVRGTQGTGENEWYTPDEYIEAARAVLGSIDLDPASSKHAQKTIKAERFFSKENDGLSQEWKGRVWLNPPYSQPDIANFADKMLEQYAAGNVSAAIMLTHNYTDTSWFQKLAHHSDSVCFTRGRIRFVSPDGDLAAPTQGQAFFYFGGNPGHFFEVFRPIGFIVRAVR